MIEAANLRATRRRAVQSGVARHAKAFGPRRHARPGRRGLFDIVRWKYAAPPFVIASHDASGCDRARTKPRDAAKATARLVNGRPASRGCARVLFPSCFLLLWRAIGSDPTRAGRTRFPWLSCGLRGRRRVRLCRLPALFVYFTG